MHNPDHRASWLPGVAAWIFGAVWYGVLGKPWQRAQGLDPDALQGQEDAPDTAWWCPSWRALVMSATHLLAAGQHGRDGRRRPAR